MITTEIKDIETPDKAEVEIFLDRNGIDLLIKKLQWLKKSGGHVHLMTPAWAGNELSEIKFGKKSTLVNHLCVAIINE
jgi:hypothetical protein